MRARLRLVERAERQQQTFELRGLELRERVGLIFAVRAAEEVRTVAARLDARVVPGSDVARSEAIRVLRERAELHEVVARDARIGRTSGGVVADKAVDHVAAKRLLKIEHVMRKAEDGRAAGSVVEIVAAATALGVCRS